jgi:RNA polymerase sigma-70 factor (sigma-E family)
LGDHAEAEDLVQSALAKTYAGWHRVRDLNAATAYARTTMVNTAASWFRRRSWRNERPTEALPETTHEHDLTDRPLLVDALGQLPPRQRAAIVLRYYEDLSEAEIADLLGISAGTVKSQASKALALLRERVPGQKEDR